MPTYINSMPIAMNIIDNTVNILTPQCCHLFLKPKGDVVIHGRT